MRFLIKMVIAVLVLWYLALTGLTIHFFEDGSYYASYMKYDAHGCIPLAICEN